MPVLRHAMLAGGEPHDLVMAFVTVPDLGVTRSEQRYTPLGARRINYRVGGSLSSQTVSSFDADGFVTLHEDYLERV